ncbi:MAG: tetraacyldisaccharide 4'-kinase [Minwuia sp.]|nr:tetraacyldisaccharide 4'-kinase [Minwuia sp.]
MKAPQFWQGRESSLLAMLLTPASWAWRSAARIRRARTTPWVAPVPVICVGNLTAGGAGKTPTVTALTRWFQARGIAVHILLRGHGGSLSAAGAHRVDPDSHGVADVGDEALLHARIAPTFIAANRVAGARLAAAGADLIIMDDGHQNPSLARDLSIIVVDLGFGLGNGRVMPAGPLRETAAEGLARANAVIAIGNGIVPKPIKETTLPILKAHVVPDSSSMHLAGRRVVAVTGIGRPEKFTETLAEMRAEVTDLLAHPDHHVFSGDDILRALDRAKTRDAVAVMTAKDHVRLPAEARDLFQTVDIHLEFQRPDMLDALLAPLLVQVSARQAQVSKAKPSKAQAQQESPA